MEKKKRKLKLTGVLFILLLIGLIILSGYIFINIPLKNIVVDGNNYLKDNYIIDYLDLDNEKIFSVSRKEIKDKLLQIDLISDIKIHKNYFGTLKINITEDKILFYNANTDKIILAKGREIPYNANYLGVPTLVSSVNEDAYKELTTKMVKITPEMIAKISEIEYSPSLAGDKIIDDKRFLFRMNDGNQVYINTVNMEKLNDYLDIYEIVVNKNGFVKGCLYLDSNSENKTFTDCHEEAIITDGSDTNNEL